MKVRDIMKTKLLSVGPDATILDAVSTMTEGHVSALPVLDAHGTIVGVLSTTDVLQAEAEADDAETRAALFESTVEDLMTTRPRTISASASVREAAAQMLHLEVHRLFVEDQSGLVGVISQTDIVRAVAAQVETGATVVARPPREHGNGRGLRRPAKVQQRF